MSSQSLQELMMSRKSQLDNGEMGWVEKGFLSVGSLQHAQDETLLRANGITHVLTVASRLKVWTDNENIHPKLPPSGITHLQVDIADHPAADLFSVLPTCLTFLTDALGSTWPQDDHSTKPHAVILIHCASGVSRSVSVAAAFLMTAGSYSLDRAMECIREGRPNASPNLGFQHQLRCLEESRCDITKASALYKEKISKEDANCITDVLRRQRDIANDLHSRIDVLEEKLASLPKLCDDNAEKVSIYVNELNSCVESLDNENAKFECISDRPATVIRRSAASKALRLIKTYDCLT